MKTTEERTRATPPHGPKRLHLSKRSGSAWPTRGPQPSKGPTLLKGIVHSKYEKYKLVYSRSGNPKRRWLFSSIEE